MHLFAHLLDCIPDSIPGERGAALCGVIKKGWGARQSVCWCAVRAGVVPPCAVATSLGSARAHLFQTSTGLLSLVLVSFRHNQVRSENVCWSLCVAAPAGRPSLRSPGSCIVQPSRALRTLPGFCAHCLSALTGALTVTSSDYEAYSPRLLQRRASRSHLITPWFASPATAITDHFVQA